MITLTIELPQASEAPGIFDSLVQTIHRYGIANSLLGILSISLLFSLPPLIGLVRDWVKRREENQVFTLLGDLTSSIKILVQQYQHSVSYEMAQLIMDSLLKNIVTDISNFTKCVVEQNSLIENRDSIESRIHLEIENQFERLKTRLVLFDYKGKNLRDFVGDNWKREIYREMILIIYNEKFPPLKKITNTEEFLRKGFDGFMFEFLTLLKSQK